MNRMTDPAVIALAATLIALAAIAALPGCATMSRDAHGRLETALDRAELGLAAAEMALAMWDAQAIAHPDIDRWPEERSKLAQAVREARAVVETLQTLTERKTP